MCFIIKEFFFSSLSSIISYLLWKYACTSGLQVYGSHVCTKHGSLSNSLPHFRPNSDDTVSMRLFVGWFLHILTEIIYKVSRSMCTTWSSGSKAAETKCQPQKDQPRSDWEAVEKRRTCLDGKGLWRQWWRCVHTKLYIYLNTVSKIFYDCEREKICYVRKLPVAVEEVLMSLTKSSLLSVL